MYKAIVLIFCIVSILSFSSCTKFESIKEPNTLPKQSIKSSTPIPVEMKTLVENFLIEIDSKTLTDIYQTDYGIKFQYIYDKDTLKEFQEGYSSVIEQMNKIIEKINATHEVSKLKSFKYDLIDLLKQKNDLLRQQAVAVEKGGKWPIQFKHGSDVNLIMALEHYGDYQELVKKIQDYNLSAKQFIEKYELDKQKYEFGDEKMIFLIS